MRIGKNPGRQLQKTPKAKDVTIAVVVHIPSSDGYFKQSLDVLKLCLASILKNTNSEYDLMVFDNNSCVEVRDYLLDIEKKGLIQFLILSPRNIGKIGAWNFIFSSAPGKYIAYNDSDIFFYPNWLTEQLTILNTFPNVGTVTGFPHRRPTKYFSNTLIKVESNPEMRLEKGLFIPDEWIQDHAQSLGHDIESYKDLMDYKIKYKGIKAYASAGHFQFIVDRNVIHELLPLTTNLSPAHKNELLFDSEINERQYLRLATSIRYVDHIGNSLSKKWMDEGKKIGFDQITKEIKWKTNKKRTYKLLHWKPIKTVLMKIYEIIYNLYTK